MKGLRVVVGNFVPSCKEPLGNIMILWFIAICTSIPFALSGFSSSYRRGWEDFKNSDFDLIGIYGKKTQKRIDLERYGVESVGCVTEISQMIFSRFPSPRVGYCIITYSFRDRKNEKFVIKKKYDDKLLEIIPKAGDQIKILYNALDPNDSVIFHEEINPEVKWYQLKQKKFTVTITNNTK